MTLIIVCILIVSCLVIIKIKSTYYPNKRREWQAAMLRYKKLQHVSLELQSRLSRHLSINTTDEITYIYYNKLLSNHDKYLSDYSYDKLKHTRSHSYINKVKKNLKLQSKELKTVEKYMSQLHKQKSLAY